MDALAGATVSGGAGSTAAVAAVTDAAAATVGLVNRLVVVRTEGIEAGSSEAVAEEFVEPEAKEAKPILLFTLS